MNRINRIRQVAVAVACALAGLSGAQAQVVADSVCPKYAVDIAAFATCDGERVAQIEAVTVVTAAQAWSRKQAAGRRVLMIDVRELQEVERTGIEAGVDAVVPWVRVAEPFEWDTERANPKVEIQPHFTALVRAWVAVLGGDATTPLILVCRDGQRAHMAAIALMDAGHREVLVVHGGTDGYVDADGTRHGGWKPAGLPWIAQVDAALIYGEKD